MIIVVLVCWPCCLYMLASNTSYIVDQLESEHQQKVTDLQIKLGDQENTLVGQKNEIKQLVEKVVEKEAHIKQLASTIEAKDRLLSETINASTQPDNDIQILHSHNDTESSIEVDAEASAKVDTKVSVSPRIVIVMLSTK